MATSYSDDELLARVLDIEEIKRVVHRRVYYIASDLRRQELEDLWVREPEHQASASFGRNWGFYVGIPDIWEYYVSRHEEHLRKQQLTNGAPALNTGNMYAHPATTGLVQLADDGATAKGMWYAAGQETLALPDGTADARWELEKIGIDFVYEAGGWKIWHLIIATDLNCEAGQSYAQTPVYIDWDNDPVRTEFGKPTIEVLTHDATFNWWDDYPPPPPFGGYDTFTDEISYGPEGWHPPKHKGLEAGEGRNFR
jgi:hypothetical protein